MKRLSILILTICFALNIFATGQIPDTLVYKGSKRYLQTYPLEPYFEKYPDIRPKTRCSSTGLWRNYVATYEIKNNQLFLKDIHILQVNNKLRKFFYKSVINEIFPYYISRKVIWFTGLMEVSYGKIIEYERFDRATFENYIVMEVKNGNITNEKHINYKLYKNFKERQFQAFLKTDEYKNLTTSFKKKQRVEVDNSLIREFILEYTTRILVK